MTSLVAQRVSFGYERSIAVIDEFSFRFPAGTLTAITAPSGRGKSTLLYLVGLMLTPTSGSVEVDGQDTKTMSDRSRARLRATRYGFVFQDAALDLSRSVMDNVIEPSLYARFNRTLALQRGRELLTRFGVDSRASARPGQVSGGQMQRIALCRALVTNPDILLADEPTGNLDDSNASFVLDVLESEAAAGKVVVVVTHDDRVLRRCDIRIAL